MARKWVFKGNRELNNRLNQLISNRYRTWKYTLSNDLFFKRYVNIWMPDDILVIDVNGEKEAFYNPGNLRHFNGAHISIDQFKADLWTEGSWTNRKVDIFNHEAAWYAYDKIGEEYAIIGWREVFTAVVAVTGIVLSIVAPPFGVLSLGIVSALVGTASLVWTGLQVGYFDAKNTKRENNARAIGLQQIAISGANKAEERRRGEQLTQHIISNPYAIMANGALYNAQAPGAEGFNYAKAYNPMDAMNGDFSNSFIDDIIQNRSHIVLAGNANYHNNLIEIDSPLKIMGLSHENAQKIITQKIGIMQAHIMDLFKRLTNNEVMGDVLFMTYLPGERGGFRHELLGGFGRRRNRDGETYLSYYTRSLLEFFINPLKNFYVGSDVLDKLKNYQRGQRANFDYSRINTKIKDSSARLADIEQQFKNIKNIRDERYAASEYIVIISLLLDRFIVYASRTAVLKCSLANQFGLSYNNATRPSFTLSSMEYYADAGTDFGPARVTSIVKYKLRDSREVYFFTDIHRSDVVPNTLDDLGLLEPNKRTLSSAHTTPPSNKIKLFISLADKIGRKISQAGPPSAPSPFVYIPKGISTFDQLIKGTHLADGIYTYKTKPTLYTFYIYFLHEPFARLVLDVANSLPKYSAKQWDNLAS